MGSIIFSIIFNDFLAINHLLCILDVCESIGEHGSVVDSLLSMQDVWDQFPVKCFQFLYATIKRERQLEVSANLSYSNNLVKIRVVLRVFRHAESKSRLYFVQSLFLKEVLVIFCWNP